MSAEGSAVNRQIVLVARPDLAPALADFALREAAMPEPADGEILVRNLYLSIDPAMRGWIAEARNYAEPVALGAVMRSGAIGRVARSRNPGFLEGEHVFGWFGWQDYAAVGADAVLLRFEPDAIGLPARLGVLGFTGITAHIGVNDICQPKPGETMVVSTAAGAVGSIAGQLGRLRGARVVGITGSAEKVRLCREVFGYDDAIDYRAEPAIGAALDRACPDGIDAYFDNVGGATLDAVMQRLKPGARIAICGTIAVPGGAAVTGPRLERAILVARARMQGFLVMDHGLRFPGIVAVLADLVRSGKLAHREDVMQGLERAPEALMRVLAGRNMGKQIVKVA